MAPRTILFPRQPVALLKEETSHLVLNAEDGTLELLRSGFLVAGVAACSALLMLFVFGGISVEGPRSNAGWLTMMLALMGMPFGLLLLLLGGAKWLRNHWLSHWPGMERRSRRR